MDAWIFRVALPVFGIVVVALVLAGCGGGPDVSGRWEGEVMPEGEPPGQFALDLEGDGGEDFRGSLTLFSESGDMQAPVSGELAAEGAFRLEPGGGIVIDGQVEGDSMSGAWFSDGMSPPFSAERVCEEEAQRRAEERTAEYRAAEREEELAERIGEVDVRISEIIEDPPSDEDTSVLGSGSVGSPTIGHSAEDRLEFLRRGEYADGRRR